MKISLLFALILLAATRCSAADPGLPFKLYRGYLIVIKCSVAGTPDVTAILDTGVSETVLDLGLARRLSLSVTETGDFAFFLGHPSRVASVLIPSIRLGSVQAENLPGIATALSSSTGELGIRPDLIIGMDLLHRQNFVIDYLSRRITFGTSTPMRWNARLSGNTHLATVDSIVMGKKLRLQVDSGFSSLLVYGRRFGPATGDKLADTTVAGVEGSTKAMAVDTADVQVGNWHTYRGTVLFSGAGSPVTDFDGVLGLWMLRPRRVAFDFLQTVLYWE